MFSYRSAILLAVLVLPASADTVAYSTFGPGDAYLTDSFHWQIASWESDAVPFTISESGSLTNLRVVAGQIQFGDPAPLTFTLRGGSTPDGAVLESWTLTTAMMPAAPAGRPYDAPLQIFTLSSVNSPVLESGVTYWLRADSSAMFGGFSWGSNSIGVTGFEYIYAGDPGGPAWRSTAADAPAPVFEVNVAPPSSVPERGGLGIVPVLLWGLVTLGRFAQAAAHVGGRAGLP